MGDGHLSTILETESDEIIKFSVKNLIPIPSEFEGISKDTCDVPVCEDPSTFDALNDHSEILSDSNNDGTSSDDDDYEDIEYVSLKEVNDVDQEEEEIDLEDILQIQDVILREKLLNISRLITNIESLNDNPTLDRVLKYPSLVPISVTDSNSFFEKFNTSFSFLDNSLLEFETFSDHTEETRSGSTTTHANNSLPKYDSFLFEVEPDQGGLTRVVMDEISNNSTNDPLLELLEFESFHFDPLFPRPPPEPPDVEICLNFEPDTAMINNFDELNEDEYFDPEGGEIDVFQNIEDDDSFTFIIRTFLLNTIEIPLGNNVVHLRSDTIRLVQNRCSFHGLRSEDPNQHLNDFLKLVDSLDLDSENRERTRLCLFQFSLRDQASNWLERLLAGSITTWEDLTTRFLA
ncbi:hypothetical protein Tco_1451160 [Tanacetum coccineum]